MKIFLSAMTITLVFLLIMDYLIKQKIILLWLPAAWIFVICLTSKAHQDIEKK